MVSKLDSEGIFRGIFSASYMERRDRHVQHIILRIAAVMGTHTTLLLLLLLPIMQRAEGALHDRPAGIDHADRRPAQLVHTPSHRHNVHAPFTAFLFVGAMKHTVHGQQHEDATAYWQHWVRLRTNVIDAFGVGNRGRAFLYLKCLSARGKWCDAKLAQFLHGGIEAVLSSSLNVSATITTVEQTETARFLNATACLTGGRRPPDLRIPRWWGAMELGAQMINEYEQSASVRFETVVLVRPDLVFDAPIGRWKLYAGCTSSTWYTAVEPPDAFWIMPRRVATHALKTLKHGLEHCLPKYDGTRATIPKAFSEFRFSWYIPCFWTLEQWGRGVRLRFSNIPSSLHLLDGRHFGYTLRDGVQFLADQPHTLVGANFFNRRLQETHGSLRHKHKDATNARDDEDFAVFCNGTERSRVLDILQQIPPSGGGIVLLSSTTWGNPAYAKHPKAVEQHAGAAAGAPADGAALIKRERGSRSRGRDKGPEVPSWVTRVTRGNR